MISAIERNIILSNKIYNKQKQYWVNTLFDKPLNFNINFPKGNIYFNGSKTEYYNFRIDNQVSKQLMEICSNKKIAMYIFFIASIKSVYFKYLSNNVIISSPIFKNNRTNDTLNNIVFLIGNIEQSDTLQEIIGKMNNSICEAYRNQDYPIHLIYKLLFPNQELPLSSISKISCSFLGIHDEIIFKESRPDLSIAFNIEENNINTRIQYNSNKFDLSVIKRFSEHFQHILELFVFNNQIKIKDIVLVRQEERQTILQEFNDTKKELPSDKLYIDLFEKQVTNFPDKIACDDRNNSLTYNKLNKIANVIAKELCVRLSDQRQVIPIYMERSVEILASMIGVLKSGCSFVVLDTEFPYERVEKIIKDCGAVMIISKDEYVPVITDLIKGNSAINYPIYLNKFLSASSEDEVNPNISIMPDELSYLAYTSGTTGMPKGAMLHHKGMLNHLIGKIDYFSINKEDIIAEVAPTSSDVFVWQFLVCSIMGGKTSVFDKKQVIDGNVFLPLLQKKCITILEHVPSWISAFLESISDEKNIHIPSLRWMITNGEAVSSKIVDDWYEMFPNIKMANVYGPAEASDDVTHYTINKKTDRQQKSISIGSPINNTHIYILDSQKELCPIGVPGEICVSGYGVGHGYLNNVEKTNNVYIPNPFINEINEKDYLMVYKTGDIGYYKEDGNIEFLGRKDAQVKINGNRVEVEEIEFHLLRHELVKEVVVTDKEDKNKNKYLCAYYVSEQLIEPSSLREHLAKSIPKYMIPSVYIKIEEIPLTANGKTDKKALPEPDNENDTSTNSIVAMSEVEEKIAFVWKEVLNVSDIKLDDNFFNLGGDSIKTLQVVSKIKKIGYTLKVQDIYNKPTILGLSLLIKNNSNIIDQSMVTGEVPLSPIQRKFFTDHYTNFHHYNQSISLSINSNFDKCQIEKVFVKIREHHDALRTVFKQALNGDHVAFIDDKNLPIDIKEFNLVGKANFEEIINDKANEIQSSLDIENGPLVALGLFYLDGSNLLLIAMHHLIVDGISWRIILEDINSLLNDIENNKELELPFKTDSFKTWMENIITYSKSNKIIEENKYWSEIVNNKSDLITTGFEIEAFVKDTKMISFQLDKKSTQQLLKDVNHAYNTNINSILLTGLGLGLRDVFKIENILISLEGHGRDDLFSNIDISRTVGWFTSEFPVNLRIEKDDDMAHQIISVKENINKIPRNGIGFGILKYLVNNSGFHLYKPEISFNYLGQFDSDINTESFTVLNKQYGDLRSKDQKLEYDIDINAIIESEVLKISLTYNQKRFNNLIISNLLLFFEKRLLEVIHFCINKKERELTPSDLTYKGLSTGKLNELKKFFEKK